MAAERIAPSVRYHAEGKVVSTVDFAPEGAAAVTDGRGCVWQLHVDRRPVAGDRTADDYTFCWELKRGLARDVSFAVDFVFDDWTADNYVFVPAIVYDGNRFATKDIGYPPFWYDKAEWREDMPTTVTASQPTLGRKGETPKAIELTSGNASTPLMACFSQKEHRAWMVQTRQGNRLGDYGLTIRENADRTAATFSVTAPVTRTGRSDDRAATVKEGEQVAVTCRVYRFKARRLGDMMDRFVAVRKTFNPSAPREVVPYSEVWRLMDRLYQERRWDERIGMYWLSDVREKASWNFVWQLGWCGGGQATYPILLNGSEGEQARAMQNLEAIYSRTQAPSGFFYAYGDGREFYGFGYGKPLADHVTFVRSQGDWLYLSQWQMNLLRWRGQPVAPHWMEGTRKLADAFVRLWDRYGQFGQFVDVETGALCIGRSAAGAIVPAGLALAWQTYGEPRYLEIACKAARAYYADYVRKGYTTGGPGEILSTPDSESAFALFESYMVLHEVTGRREWLRYAAELLPICASWTVSYDFDFPAASWMGKTGARSCGAVWASVANKHAAPGICTWSGLSLLKYFRATGDARALELLTDIAHGLPQYISRRECRIGNMPPGGVCERVNLSDWEGKNQVGGSIFGSCSWCEVAAMLTVTRLPGIYVQTDRRRVAVFDHVKVEQTRGPKGRLTLRITNPTDYPAEVKVFAETERAAGKTPLPAFSNHTHSLRLKAGESREMTF